jgi:hypothetical protein
MLLGKWKKNQLTDWRIYLKHIYLVKDTQPKYVKNFQNSIVGKANYPLLEMDKIFDQMLHQSLYE